MNYKYKLITLIICVFILAGLSKTSHAFYSNKEFLVYDKYSYNKVLLVDSSKAYLVTYGYGCYSWDMNYGSSVYIDTYSSPGIFNTMYVPGILSTSSCSISNSKTLYNLQEFELIEEFNSNSLIILKDSRNKIYIAEYGIGCGLSLWRYEGKTVHIDIGGTKLDGIGDTMYLFDDNSDCIIWNAEQIKKDYLNYIPTPSTPVIDTPQTPTPQQTEGYNFTKKLQKGSKGADVDKLNAFLIEKGFLKSKKASKQGIFNSATKQALVKYQKSVGLSKSGILDSSTRQYINSLY